VKQVSAHQLLAASGHAARHVALLGPIENDTGVPARFTAPAASVSVAVLPADLKVDVALVAAGAGDTLDAVVPLLARLRDVHAGCVVFQDTAEIAAAGDMLALGFEAKESPSTDGLLYVRDPAEAERPREWNNSRNWANPDNFSRYRW
jgi:hypothetical protein